MMKKLFILSALAVVILLPGDSVSRGPGGGGRGGGGGGGGYRGGAGGHTPSFSGGGHSPQASRPNGGARPGMVPQHQPGSGSRPGGQPGNVNPGSRPNVGGNNRPNTGGNNRPSWADNRPNTGGNNRPGYRPENHPNWADNRSNFRPDTRPNWADNRRPDNRPNNWPNTNRPWNGNQSWYHHYYPYHNNWYHGGWNYWRAYPVCWGGAGWLGTGQTTYVYSNPYYDQSVAMAAPVDYSQMIPPPPVQASYQAPQAADAAPPAPAAEEPADANTQLAMQQFEASQAAFKKGDYRKALELVDKSIQMLPSDAALHEFRALVLFALKDYRNAASTIYAVLAAGPGWDWETMRSLYPDEKTYTDQLRALESYHRANPKSPEANFLLAYHYLVLAHPDAAAKQLEQVVQMQPNDKVSAQLLQALKQQNNRPTPEAKGA